MHFDEDQDDLAREGMVFNIQKYSVHDGPGIRTIVFLKGCPLRCDWCSNPESQQPYPELAWNSGRCLGFAKCGHCHKTCKSGAITQSPDGAPVIDRALCKDCGHLCAEACPAQGMIVYGKRRNVEDVLKRVEQDMAFYARSGGGMTVSGGEPLHQKDFTEALLRQARKRHIKTTIETCGMAPADNLRAVLPWLNNALFDIKHIDSNIHKKGTGAENGPILDNFRILAEEFPKIPVLARTPVIPGFNDNEDAIAQIATFLKPFVNVRYEMLPYHRLGTQKYHFLNRKPPMDEATLDKSILPGLFETARKILGERVLPIK